MDAKHAVTHAAQRLAKPGPLRAIVAGSQRKRRLGGKRELIKRRRADLRRAEPVPPCRHETAPDRSLAVGGLHHLVEIAETELPTFFIRDASCILSLEKIVHYDLHHREEKTSNYSDLFSPDRNVTVGITAGASCPNNLIEETILKIFDLRGICAEELKNI